MACKTWYMIKIYCHEKELSKKNVFSCLLNTVNEGAEVTLGGRLLSMSTYIYIVLHALVQSENKRFKCCQNLSMPTPELASNLAKNSTPTDQPQRKIIG